MAKGKKVSRKKLLKEPDEILTTTARLFQFAVRHRYPLLGGLAGLILIVAVVSAVRYHAASRENESFAALQLAWQTYQEQRQDADAQAAFEAVRDDFETLLDRYEGTAGANYGKLVFADISFDAGEPERSIALYQEALEEFDAPEIRNRILNGLAYAFEAQGDLPAAVRNLEQILDSEAPVFKPQARYNLGRLYGELGDPGKSRTAFETLLTENPDSLYAAMVRERLAAEAPPAAALSDPQRPGD